MSQSTILAAGQTATATATQTVAAGAVVTVGLFTSNAGGLPAGAAADVNYITPGNAQAFASLSGTSPFTQVQGPCEFQVARHDISAYGVDVGVFLES